MVSSSHLAVGGLWVAVQRPCSASSPVCAGHQPPHRPGHRSSIEIGSHGSGACSGSLMSRNGAYIRRPYCIDFAGGRRHIAGTKNRRPPPPALYMQLPPVDESKTRRPRKDPQCIVTLLLLTAVIAISGVGCASCSSVPTLDGGRRRP